MMSNIAAQTETLVYFYRSSAAPSALIFKPNLFPAYGRAYLLFGPLGLEICKFRKHWTHACITRAEGPGT